MNQTTSLPTSRATDSAVPTVEDFDRADRHLPSGVAADAYYIDGHGNLLPLVAERYTDGPSPSTLYCPFVHGQDGMIGFSPVALGRKMIEGRAWMASAKRVALSCRFAVLDDFAASFPMGRGEAVAA